MLKFCWLIPLLMEIDAATFEVHMTNYFQRYNGKTDSMTIFGHLTYFKASVVIEAIK